MVSLSAVRCDNSFCNTIGAHLACGRCRSVEYCSAECQKTAWKAHHNVLCDLSEVPPPKLDDPVPYSFYDRQGQITELNQETFQKITGFPFTAKAVLSAETLLAIRRGKDPEVVQSLRKPTQSDSIEDPVGLYPIQSIQKTDPCFIAYEKNPPRLNIVETSSMGLGVKAAQPIKKDEIIAHFGGEVILNRPNTYRNAQYSTGLLDQRQYAGIGVLINDGPPNCAVRLGPELQNLVVATRDIEKNEDLYWDYGPRHNIKTGPYSITKKAYSELTHLSSKKIDIEGHEARLLNYVIHTPSVFVQLLLDGYMKTEKILSVLHHMDQIYDLSPHLTPCYYTNYREYIRNVADIRRKGRKTIEAVKCLTTHMSTNSYLLLLSLLATDKILKPSSMNSYQITGELIDELYRFINGTLRGTYLGRPDPFPEVNLNRGSFVARWNTLSPSQKDLIFKLSKVFQNDAIQNNLERQAKDLMHLVKTLESSTRK